MKKNGYGRRRCGEWGWEKWVGEWGGEGIGFWDIGRLKIISRIYCIKCFSD